MKKEAQIVLLDLEVLVFGRGCSDFVACIRHCYILLYVLMYRALSRGCW